jgi:GH25 family lysozyme M1 (1,4-beta-N-acetylmuramidase)
MYGIDASDNNGTKYLNMDDVYEPGFIIAKATQGVSITDGTYEIYREIASSRKVPFGAYHYYTGGGAAEAEAFVSYAKPQNFMSLWCDYEVLDSTPQEDAEGLAGFCERTWQLTGMRPGLYADIYDLGRIARWTKEMAFSHLWLSAPSYPVGDPALPYKCDIHQWCLGNPYDLDYCNWDHSEWNKAWTYARPGS